MSLFCNYAPECGELLSFAGGRKRNPKCISYPSSIRPENVLIYLRRHVDEDTKGYKAAIRQIPGAGAGKRQKGRGDLRHARGGAVLGRRDKNQDEGRQQARQKGYCDRGCGPVPGAPQRRTVSGNHRRLPQDPEEPVSAHRGYSGSRSIPRRYSALGQPHGERGESPQNHIQCPRAS